MAKDKDDRDRRAWRDIDRKRDGSVHVDRKDPYKKAKRGQSSGSASSGYKSALDSFFEGGELPERFKKLGGASKEMKKGPASKRQAALKDLREAVGRFDVKDAAAKYFAIDPELPRDADALIALLQHPDEEILERTLAMLSEMVDERPPKRAELLRQRLRQVEDLSEDPAIAREAVELRRKI